MHNAMRLQFDLHIFSIAGLSSRRSRLQPIYQADICSIHLQLAWLAGSPKLLVLLRNQPV